MVYSYPVLLSRVNIAELPHLRFPRIHELMILLRAVYSRNRIDTMN